MTDSKLTFSGRTDDEADGNGEDMISFAEESEDDFENSSPSKEALSQITVSSFPIRKDKKGRLVTVPQAPIEEDIINVFKKYVGDVEAASVIKEFNDVEAEGKTV
jgi:hypothetical protein